MDFVGSMFCLSNGNREQNGNSNNVNFAWDSWEPATSVNSRLINAFYTANASAAESTGAATRQEASLANALMFLPRANHDDGAHHQQQQQQQALYSAADGSHVHPDPHLTCLKLGKRHYFEDANAPSLGSGGGFPLAGKRGKGYNGRGGGGGTVKAASFATAAVPRCQVEGCHVALLNAKDYHRRHKVCEMHSKAPKVVVLGLEQRFCQQCSRFHVVSEFDDSKRSCRRRLAGHNKRRRKSSLDSVARNPSQAGCARSLLSSKNDSWLSPADLSSRCSAALRELIAENRAAIMARQLISDRDWHSHHNAVEDLKEIQHEYNYFPQQQHMFP
ncbi:hypothetical protein L6164_003609 [Bauhinia variegata]|uniref:Uncharacterized protein n=1 Tax=Bauhinia variegata TaxID=167791 RepID=A0ACB9Q7B2_BAUVA|nr:hypothetical protein L6164_003609 [Bauhinia variegata]